jgi:hypothetical protein
MPTRPFALVSVLALAAGGLANARVTAPDAAEVRLPVAAPIFGVDAMLAPPAVHRTRTLVERTRRVEDETVASRVEAAVATLGGVVGRSSHPDALRLAFAAYFNFQGRHPDKVRKPYLFFVDYGLDSATPRGYVFDMRALSLVEGPFTVAHGRGSANGREGIPTRFSNAPRSNSTSLGLFLAQETYAFSGTSSGQRYRSVGLRLNGVSGPFNSAARARGVVAHGAPYVTPSSAGRSEGCPAVEEERAQRLLPRLSNGGMLFLFSPQDREWMRSDPWVGTVGRVAAAR